MADNNSPNSGVQAVAQALLRARETRQPAASAPYADALPDAQAAYQVQEHVARTLQQGHAGAWSFWKSGGPSREVPLTHAPLPQRNVWNSPADASTHPFGHRIVEGEVAFRLREAVTAQQAAGLTHEQAKRLVGEIAVTIEVVDFRWAEAGSAPALLKLADLGSHGALVVGTWRPFEDRDWSTQQCHVRIGSAAPRSFTGTHTLKDPTWLLPGWLKHATGDGGTVPAGTVVTTGTWCGMLHAKEGDLVHVTFDGIGEASVQL
ncbi:MAG TPA: fumarylacetoacetate hydrolase family protein [Ramlibacter sp.]|nr:fumarylacetoacetate hydrolase family protein [Ramlibacter sp.]